MKSVRKGSESLRETLEILNDREIMESLKRSDEDVKAGRVGVIKNKKYIFKLFVDRPRHRKDVYD